MSYKRFAAFTAAAALMMSLTACGQEQVDQSNLSTGTAVQVVTVGSDTISTENKVSGTVVADNEHSIIIGSSVKCTNTYVEAGDAVQAGEIICTLDMSSILSSYSAASISYSSAAQSYQDQAAVFASQIELYAKNVNDLKALLEIGAASQLEVDQAQLQLDSAVANRNATLSQLEAGMQSYKSSVEQLDMVLEHVDSQGNVISPITGTLVTLNAEENNYISASLPVAVIDAADQMKVTVSISEALVPKLSIGDQVDVSVSAANQTFVGTIRAMEKAASAQTKLYNVTISVPEEVSGLLSGMFADVTFRTDISTDAIVIPTEAIMTNGDTQYVVIVGEDNIAHIVEIATGLTGDGVTEITSGLTGGEQLVTVGQSYVSDGDAVRIVGQEG